MVKKRMRAAAVSVPQTMEEAIARAARFATLDAELEGLKLEADQAKAEIDEQRDLLASPLVAEMKAIVAELKPFWEARATEITGGKRKSTILGGCEIGTRTGNPTLGYPKEHEAELIEELDLLGFRSWALREALELDKPAIIKALRPEAGDRPGESDAIVLRGLGFTVRQTESFFVARATSEPAEAAGAGRAVQS
jgi:phage host-nuclease inhibitor protein Gam